MVQIIQKGKRRKMCEIKISNPTIEEVEKAIKQAECIKAILLANKEMEKKNETQQPA